MSETAFKSGFVAIVGRPNVGKSTLLNYLVGEHLAAVSPKAQTTRRRFRGIRNEDEGATHYQMIFIDMPGIHVPPESKLLNQFCLEEAVDALQDADIYIYMIDASREFLAEHPASDESLVIASLKRARARNPEAVLAVLANKVDIAGGAEAKVVENIRGQLLGLGADIFIPTAVEKNTGLPELLNFLRANLPAHPPYYPTDIVSDENMRVIAAEQIQEQIYRNLGEEIPYECAVEIEKYQEPKGHLKKTEIHASIHVERNSQKQIVVGRGGEKIKEIGRAARERLEKLIGGGVVLKLFVKENPGWTRDKARMKRLGYVLPKSNESAEKNREL